MNIISYAPAHFLLQKHGLLQQHVDFSFNLLTLPYNQAGHMGASELSTENDFELPLLRYFWLLCKGKQLSIS